VKRSEAGSPAEDRDGFRFRGGSAAIDLTATLQARLSQSPRELLVVPQDLDRWLASAGLSTNAAKATQQDLQMARELREAIFTLAGQPSDATLDAAPLATLNSIAAMPSAVPQLSGHGRAELRGSPQALLSSLAREAVQLLGGEDVGPVRQCQASACTIYFVDTSRSQDRRWCSMLACGNRAKVELFRRRKQERKHQEQHERGTPE
jgi:predicted RNA-binding Zn ribbon-like protein